MFAVLDQQWATSVLSCDGEGVVHARVCMPSSQPCLLHFAFHLMPEDAGPESGFAWRGEPFA